MTPNGQKFALPLSITRYFGIFFSVMAISIARYPFEGGVWGPFASSPAKSGGGLSW